MYTVKQLAELAGVSVRTLHYYDAIGLLKPTSVGENGYRYYEEEAALRLQQILFFRELDLSLSSIKTIMEQPEFDLLAALKAHRQALQAREKRLTSLIETVDKTLTKLTGEIDMDIQDLFAEFDAEKQKQYEQEIRERYDPKVVAESAKRWRTYTPEDKARIKAEGEAIYRDLAAQMSKGPASAEVQGIIARWHQHLRYFYEPTPEMLEGLGHLYNQHPDFIANFKRIHPALPAFLEQAIATYCQGAK